MRAYKVLRDGRSEFTGWRWPLPDAQRPGEWVHAHGPIALAATESDAADREQLPHGSEPRSGRSSWVARSCAKRPRWWRRRRGCWRRLHAWDEAMRHALPMCLLAPRRSRRDTRPAPDWSRKVEHTLSWAGSGARRVLHRDAGRRERNRQALRAGTTTPRSWPSAPGRRCGCATSSSSSTEPSGRSSGRLAGDRRNAATSESITGSGHPPRAEFRSPESPPASARGNRHTVNRTRDGARR